MGVAARIVVTDFGRGFLIQLSEIARPHEPRRAPGQAQSEEHDEKDLGFRTNNHQTS
jgi:hypothetical protein